RATLNQANEAGKVVDGDDGLVILRIDRLEDLLRLATPGMLLKEALAAYAIRAANKRERTIDDERSHARPDLGVILGKSLLGDARLRPIDPIGMCQLETGGRALGWFGAVRLANYLFRILVIPEPLE